MPRTIRSPSFLIVFVAGALLAAPTVRAQSGSSWKDSVGPRTEKPWTLSGTFGHPAPSFIGGSLGYQASDLIQFVGAAGTSWFDDINIYSFSFEARVHMFTTRLTPMFGGGANLLLFKGSGSIQGLHSTSLLGTVHVGLDWVVTEDCRVSAGWSFQFPIRLSFPFVDVGIMF